MNWPPSKIEDKDPQFFITIDTDLLYGNFFVITVDQLLNNLGQTSLSQPIQGQFISFLPIEGFSDYVVNIQFLGIFGPTVNVRRVGNRFWEKSLKHNKKILMWKTGKNRI